MIPEMLWIAFGITITFVTVVAIVSVINEIMEG